MENKEPLKSSWWGPFYCDSKDIRLTVPKRMGVGWTLNFGHRRVVGVAAGVIILLAILVGRLTNH